MPAGGKYSCEYLLREERSQISNLSFYLKTLEKEQMSPQAGRREEKNKVSSRNYLVESNTAEINKTKISFFQKINR
jgi:hypothetical protein